MAIHLTMFNLIHTTTDDAFNGQVASSSSQQETPVESLYLQTQNLIALTTHIFVTIVKKAPRYEYVNDPVDVAISPKLKSKTLVYSLPFANKIVLKRSFFENYANNTHMQVYKLLFEWMNVKSKPRFGNLYELPKLGNISKIKFVEGVEKIEHRNALMTQRILTKAVTKKLLDQLPNKDLLLFEDFTIHFKLQQFLGHSQQIGKTYDKLILPKNPVCFRGTFPIPKNLSETSKAKVIAIFYSKRDALNDDKAGEAAKRNLGLKLIDSEKSTTVTSEVKAIHALFTPEEITELKLSATATQL